MYRFTLRTLFEKRSKSNQGLEKEEKPGFSSFFLSGIGKNGDKRHGRAEKNKNMYRKRSKKSKKICKKFLAFPGLKCYTIKRTFARGLFSNPQKENAFQKFTTENSPTRGARSKERRIHHEG